MRSAFCVASFFLILSAIALGSFCFSRWFQISTISHYRLASLLLLHLFFIFMVYKLSKIEVSLTKLLEWIVQWNAGIFVICNIAQVIVYLNSPKFVQNILFFELELDPAERVILALWNYWFIAMWIYNSLCFLVLVLILIIFKKLQQRFNENRIIALEQNIQKTYYDSRIYLNQTNCSICLHDYERNQNIDLLKCGHVFHTECLDGWTEDNITCPLCRANIIG